MLNEMLVEFFCFEIHFVKKKFRIYRKIRSLKFRNLKNDHYYPKKKAAYQLSTNFFKKKKHKLSITLHFPFTILIFVFVKIQIQTKNFLFRNDIL